MSVTAYGSQLEDGLLSSRNPTPFSSTWKQKKSAKLILETILHLRIKGWEPNFSDWFTLRGESSKLTNFKMCLPHRSGYSNGGSSVSYSGGEFVNGLRLVFSSQTLGVIDAPARVVGLNVSLVPFSQLVDRFPDFLLKRKLSII